MSFKVTDVGSTNRKPVCDFLLVINYYPISYRFEVIGDYCSNFGRKTTTLRLTLPLKSLGVTYTVHLRLIGKLVVDFLFALIEFFSLGVTAEALRANID